MSNFTKYLKTYRTRDAGNPHLNPPHPVMLFISTMSMHLKGHLEDNLFFQGPLINDCNIEVAEK